MFGDRTPLLPFTSKKNYMMGHEILAKLIREGLKKKRKIIHFWWIGVLPQLFLTRYLWKNKKTFQTKIFFFKYTIFGNSSFQNVWHARILPTCPPAPPSTPWAQSPQWLQEPPQLPSCRRSTGPCGYQIQPKKTGVLQQGRSPRYHTVA